MDPDADFDYGRNWATGTEPYDPTLQRYIRKCLLGDPTYDLCEICRTIDFDAIRDVHPATVSIEYGEFFPVFLFPEGLQWFTMSCPFCRLMEPHISVWRTPRRTRIFWQLGFGNTWTKHPAGLGLMFIGAHRDEVHGILAPEHELLLYAAVPTTGNYCAIKPQRHLNDRWLRKELELCRSLHGHETSTKPVPKLRLIDCATMTVISAPDNAEYFALSYVWSKSGSPSTDSSHEQINVPAAVTATIDDATKLVLRLGKQFLWVDRLCIDQHDLAQRCQQIACMGDIYQNAFATIVMLDGDDSRPLPGVSTLMTDRRFARVRSGIIAIRAHLPREVEKSTWHERGWTFQEAYLSTRIIYMSMFGILLSCRRQVLEDLPSEVDLAPNPRILWHPDTKRTPGFALDAGSAYPWDVSDSGVMASLKNYTQRSLTYERDALDAFRGYLQSRGVWSYWGIPMLDFESKLTEFRNPPSLFAASAHSLGFCRGLTWFRLDPTLRGANMTTEERDALRGLWPSWAWPSARYTARYSGLEHTLSRSIVPSLVLMITQAGIVSAETFFGQGGPPQSMPEQSPYLQVKAALLPITITADYGSYERDGVEMPALTSSDTMQWHAHSEEPDHDDADGKEMRATHVLLLWATISEQLETAYDRYLATDSWCQCEVYWLSVVECADYWRLCGLVTSVAEIRRTSAVGRVRQGTEGSIGESEDFPIYRATALLDASRDALARELSKLPTRTILLG